VADLELPAVAAPFEGTLDLTNRQGKYGEHLVQLIVSAAGFQSSKPDDIGDGVDLVISRTHRRGEPLRLPNVEVQVKASRSLRSVGENWSFDLEVGHYDCLRTPGGVPRYLVVVDIRGDDPADWVSQTDQHFAFHKLAYWTSLVDEPGTDNAATIAVPIPKVNIYTPAVVADHMRSAREEFERFWQRATS
jgi:hypothetical protein